VPNFGVNWNATNTASSTVPMGVLQGTAAIAGAVYEINSGSDASADNAVKYSIMRTTSQGTTSATVVPNDIGMGAATAACVFGTAWNINPTITATSQILQWAQHQRGTYRWVAYDYTKMLRTGCGASTFKGLALMSVVVSATFNAVFNIEYEE
jgi:hypothetical protein